ncbi:MAG: glycosyl transferase, group 1, partial [Deltaproteobacteria bacterium]|nr:glycosyl transferase, group 1 [Deltaproteobacteria bacterium]
MMTVKSIGAMKVLKIIHTQGHGGAENTFRWLAWGLIQEGVEVTAAIPETIALQDETWINSALKELNIPHLTFNKSGSPSQLLMNMGAIIDTVKPDIVHSHLLDSNFYSSLASRRRGIPHISTEHGDVSLGQTISSRVKYGLISLCSRFIVCVSHAVRLKASRLIPVRSKLKTIYNGIHFIESCASSFREEFQIPRSGFLIGNVGNLYPVKGQKYLVRAFSELVRTCSAEVYLVLVGR